MKTHVLLTGLCFAIVALAHAQAPGDRIRLNQVGYFPAASKKAAIVGAGDQPFYILSGDKSDTVFTGRLGEERYSVLSGEYIRTADFSGIKNSGTYTVLVPEVGYSYPFEVKPAVFREVLTWALKSFYFQRVSLELTEPFAGKWRRPAGHPDDRVLIHPSAASSERPIGSFISAPRGWYDAGDYNKYIVNSGITTATLLSLYEDFPEYAGTIKTSIPESGNRIPDLLDEILWNVRWMLAMQDPVDGGVYTKLTEASFSAMVLPHEVTVPRYVVQKSTAAALDFAAVMAQSARIFRSFENELPGLADTCLAGAVRAWNWARLHPDVLYEQNRMNERFDPDIQTGGYGDRDLDDEWIWAATELFVTTKADSFYTARNGQRDQLVVPSWGDVGTLADYTLYRFTATLTGPAKTDLPDVERRIVKLAERVGGGVDTTAYEVPLLLDRKDLVWGSNAVAANQAIAFIYAYRISGNPVFLDNARSTLDYLLGKNATGYSFLTGFGEKSPMHPHHRLSEGDRVVEPVPGLLVGGPNPGRQDRCTYLYDEPARSYVDDVCSYASNEIAINWNAPFVYLVGALEAIEAGR